MVKNLDERRKTITDVVGLMHRDIVPGYSNEKTAEYSDFQSTIENEYGLIYYDDNGGLHYNDDDNKPVPIEAPEGFVEWKTKRDAQKEKLSELIGTLSSSSKSFEEMVSEISLTSYALEISDVEDMLNGTLIDDTTFEDCFYRFVGEDKVNLQTVIFPEIAENIGHSYSVLSKDVSMLPEVALYDNSFIAGYLSSEGDVSKREPEELDDFYFQLGEDIQSRFRLGNAKERYLGEVSRRDYLDQILGLIKREQDLEKARKEAEEARAQEKTEEEMEK